MILNAQSSGLFLQFDSKNKVGEMIASPSVATDRMYKGIQSVYRVHSMAIEGFSITHNSSCGYL